MGDVSATSAVSVPYCAGVEMSDEERILVIAQAVRRAHIGKPDHVDSREVLEKLGYLTAAKQIVADLDKTAGAL